MPVSPCGFETGLRGLGGDSGEGTFSLFHPRNLTSLPPPARQLKSSLVENEKRLRFVLLAGSCSEDFCPEHPAHLNLERGDEPPSLALCKSKEIRFEHRVRRYIGDVDGENPT